MMKLLKCSDCFNCVERDVTDQLYEKATQQDKTVSQIQPKSAGARIPVINQQSMVSSESPSQSQKTPTTEAPPVQSKAERHSTRSNPVPFKFRPNGDTSVNNVHLKGPKPWIPPSSKTEGENSNVATSTNTGSGVSTSLPVQHIHSVSKSSPEIHRQSSKKFSPYSHSSFKNLKVSVIPSNPDPEIVTNSPTIDKNASPSVWSSINKLENKDSKEGKMDWHTSSRNKIKELRRMSEEGVLSTRRTSDPKDGNHQRSESSGSRHSPVNFTVKSNKNLPSSQNGGLVQNGRKPSPRTSPVTIGANSVQQKQKSFTSHNANHNTMGDNPAKSIESVTDRTDSAVLELESPLQRNEVFMSEEEQKCNEQASLLASHVKDTDRRLSEILSPPAEHKTTTFFMDGIFDTKVDLSRSPSILQKVDKPKVRRRESSPPQSPSEKTDSLPRVYDSSLSCPSPRTSIEHNTFKNENLDSSIEEQKGDLIARIEKKLQILEGEKEFLQDEEAENARLGMEVTTIVEQRCKTKGEFDKYKLYVDELDKVMLLLLRVSGRLAKAQNALQSLPENASSQQRTSLTSKRDEISQKHEDAIQLKEGIDRRRHQVDKYLKEYLTEEEFLDYDHFIKMKSKLSMDKQELEDKIRLGEEQLKELQISLESSASQ